MGHESEELINCRNVRSTCVLLQAMALAAANESAGVSTMCLVITCTFVAAAWGARCYALLHSEADDRKGSGQGGLSPCPKRDTPRWATIPCPVAASDGPRNGGWRHASVSKSATRHRAPTASAFLRCETCEEERRHPAASHDLWCPIRAVRPTPCSRLTPVRPPPIPPLLPPTPTPCRWAP